MTAGASVRSQKFSENFNPSPLSQRGTCFIDADFCGFFRRHTSGPCNLDTLLEMLCFILMMR